MRGAGYTDHMPRLSSAGPLSSRERLVLALIASALIALSSVYLLQRSFRRTVNLTELYERVIFSNSFFIRPDVDPSRVFDGDTATAWWDDLKVDPDRPRAHVSQAKPSALPGRDLFYLQMELGMTHFPDRPPRINRLEGLRFWSGNQKDEATFGDYARPRKVHLHIFYQGVVDFDREYRFPGSPVHVASKTVTLEDRFGPQTVPVDFLPATLPSPRFPYNVSLVWLRAEIESYYPGRKFRNRVALSEIDFLEEIPTHAPPERRQP